MSALLGEGLNLNIDNADTVEGVGVLVLTKVLILGQGTIKLLGARGRIQVK